MEPTKIKMGEEVVEIPKIPYSSKIAGKDYCQIEIEL